MSDEQWGPWIEHDGMGCPCVGKYVEVEHEFGDNLIIPCVNGSWGWCGRQFRNGRLQSRVIRYRIRKPKGLQILQDILREVEDDGGVGYNEREMEDASP